MANYLTTKQAALRLGICKRHVARLIAEGRLPAIKPGHDWLISTDDLDNLVRRPVGRPTGSPDSKPRQRREEGTTMYLAISTTNPANGWQIYATGDNKTDVEADATKKIGPILNQWGQSDLVQETLHKNLRVVSKIQARRFFVRPEFLDEEIAKFDSGYYNI